MKYGLISDFLNRSTTNIGSRSVLYIIFQFCAQLSAHNSMHLVDQHRLESGIKTIDGMEKLISYKNLMIT